MKKRTGDDLCFTTEPMREAPVVTSDAENECCDSMRFAANRDPRRPGLVFSTWGSIQTGESLGEFVTYTMALREGRKIPLLVAFCPFCGAQKKQLPDGVKRGPS